MSIVVFYRVENGGIEKIIKLVWLINDIYAHYTPIEILAKRVWSWCQRESSTKKNLDTPKLIISKKLFLAKSGPLYCPAPWSKRAGRQIY